MTNTVKISILSALFFTTLCLPSCKIRTEGGDKALGGMKTEEVEDAVEIKLAEDRKDVYNLSYKIEYPVSGFSEDILQKVTKSVVECAFGTNYVGMSIPDAAAAYKKDRASEYVSDNSSLLEDALAIEGLDEEIDLSWDEQLQGYFLSPYKRIASYIIYNYVYEGGAHGMETEVSVNINLETGELVEEEDFFAPGYESVLGGMISSHLSDSFDNNEDYESLFIKDVEPNGNFSISNQGVTYIYQPYEIGPYSLSVIKVLVPWSEIEAWVK